MKKSCSHSGIFKWLFAALISFVPLVVFAQESTTCAENLKTAQSLFDKGQVEQVPSMLRECMKSGFKREEELAAYKLLIQSFIFEDKIDQADSAMMAFLKKNPEYQLSPTDHSSFVYLFNTFNVKPVVQVAFHFGTNMPFLTFIEDVSLASEPNGTTYSSKALNLFTSLEAKFAIGKKLELNVEGGFSQSKFKNVEEFMDFGLVDYTETQSRIEIPVTATYNIAKFGKLTPYIRAGGGAAFDLKSTAKAKVIPIDPMNQETVTGPDIGRDKSRILMDLFAQTGAGIKFKTNGGFINLEVRSNFGILNQAVRDVSTDDYQTLSSRYYYLDDNFNLNNLNFSLGYTQIFYKPSKRK
jgi:hypothetical protein